MLSYENSCIILRIVGKLIAEPKELIINYGGKIVTKKRELLLSKLFLYPTIIIALTFFICLSSYEVWLGNDLAERFLPTLCGLLVTFGIFTVFFDVREEREWKTVREKVMRRISNQLQAIAADVSYLYDADVNITMNDINEVGWNKMSRKYLDALVSGKFKLTYEGKDKEVNQKLAETFLLRERMLGGIEDVYGKFLKSDIQRSLMNLEDYLHNLSFDFTLINKVKNYKPEKVPDLIQKIGQEIDHLSKSGVKVF
jgi:hypothetical protein